MDSPSAASESVVTFTAVVVSEPFPAAVESVIPPVANRLVRFLADTDFPVESFTETVTFTTTNISFT